MYQKRRTIWCVCALAVVSTVLWAPPGSAEFWRTEYFLQQSSENQISFLSGLLDMYQYTRDEIAPDPDDWVRPCTREFTLDEMRQNDPLRISYDEASRLVDLGADIDDLMNTCGISRPEAELVSALRKRQAA